MVSMTSPFQNNNGNLIILIGMLYDYEMFLTDIADHACSMVLDGWS